MSAGPESSLEPQPLEAVVDTAAPSPVSASDADAWKGALDDSPRWPVTRLAAITLTLLLGVAVAAPVLVAHRGHLDQALLLLPAIVAALSARLLFETLETSNTRGGVGRHFVCALAPAALAVAMVAASSVIVGVGLRPAAMGATAGLTLAVLTGAGAARDVEIRVRLSLRRVYLIGSQNSHRDLARELSLRRDATLVGTATADGPGAADRLVSAIRASRATVLVLNHDAMQNPALVEVASRLNLDGLHIRDLVSYYESEFKKVPLEELSPTWFLFDIASIHRRRSYHRVRRVSELVISLGLLLLALPVLLIAAIAVKTTSRGPLLYRQQRVGRGGVPFTVVKVRTMTQDTGGEALWAGAEVRRITPVGSVLRRFRIDEIPQLWSVVRGGMALIGPRPEQVPIAQRLEQELPHYGARHCIRPGITGWAQVNLGYAGSTEGTMAKLQRDLFYIKHASLRLDALIIWLTLKTVLSGRG